MKTLTVKEIKQYVEDGWKASAYGGKDGWVSEVSFTKTNPNGNFVGFSYMCCEIRQREMKSLLRRVQKVLPKLKMKT